MDPLNNRLPGGGPGPLPPEAMALRPFRVVARRQELADTVSLHLVPASASASASAAEGGLPFEPGQFNMVYALGHGEVAISISGDPAEPERLVHTIRDMGGVTAALCRTQVGDELGIRGPYGSPWPLAAAEGRDVVVISGGLGLAPVRPLLYQLLAQSARFGHLNLLHGARTPGDLLFREELEAWVRGDALRTYVSVDRAGPAWVGHVGVVTGLLGKLQADPQRGVAFLCGPEIMMKAVAQTLCRQGWDGDRIFLSMERNMKCAVGLCGHCQLGAAFICKDGPVLSWSRLKPLLAVKER